MPIQFNCANCSSPIEVDDQYANQMATCPYCNTVIKVPEHSTFTPQATITARPTDPGRVPPPLPGMPPGPGMPPPLSAQMMYGELSPAEQQRRRSATSWGIYAIVCAGLVVVLSAVLAIAMLSAMQQDLSFTPTSQPSQQEIQEWSTKYMTTPTPMALVVGLMFFGLIGAILAIVSLRIKSTWQGIVTIIIRGPTALCLCGGNLISAISALAGGGG